MKGFLILTIFSLSYGFYGHITKDTTWRDTVLITGDVVVDSGVCLKIEPGSVVLFESCQWESPESWFGSEIICNRGSLEALGTPQDSIYFLEGEQWGITLRHGSAIIEYSRISGGVETNFDCRDSSALILKNSRLGHFVRAAVWFFNSTKLVVDNCILKPVQGSYIEQCGIWARNSDSIFIFNSAIGNLKGADYYIYEPPGQPAIGIRCEDCKYVSVLSTTISEIRGGEGSYGLEPENDIPAGNGTGILFTNTSGVVRRCKITRAIGGYFGPEGHGVGIWCIGESQVTIGGSLDEGNNIYDNSSYQVVNYTPNDIIATYNWWGTTDQDIIEEYIYDRNDNSNYGYVIYQPWAEYPLGIGEKVKDKGEKIKLSVYPNPAKGKVFIKYQGISLPAILQIYDISGRLTKNFSIPESKPQSGIIQWDSRNREGEKVPNGVYFCRVVEDKRTEIIKKIVLVK